MWLSLPRSIMEFGATNLAVPHHISLVNSLESLADYRERRNRFRSYGDVRDEELAFPKPCYAAAGMHLGYPGVHAKSLRRLRGTTSLPVEGDAGHEIMDILFNNKVNSGEVSPNAYFHGSPPCRASNPMIHDAHFTQKRAMPSPVIISQKSSCSSPVIGGTSSAKSNSSAKSSYCSSTCGSKPFIRIEGFASTTSDSNRGVPAYA